LENRQEILIVAKGRQQTYGFMPNATVVYLVLNVKKTGRNPSSLL